MTPKPYEHMHRFTFGGQYAWCACGEMLIRDGERFREMTRDEIAASEAGYVEVGK